MKVKCSTDLRINRESNKESSKTISLAKLLSLIFLACTATGLFTYLAAVDQPRPERWQPYSSQLASWAHRKGYWSTITSSGLVKALLLAPGKALFSGNHETIPAIAIDIKFKHLIKIRAKRSEALKKGLLIQGENDYVPASIRYGNRTVKVKMRLKGDALDHLQEDKWSFRIHTKGNDQLFGLRRFSIQAPWVRAFHGEILFGETLRHVGVLAPRYFLVNVTINGDDIGVMAVEEHFSKELLEINKRREGVIVKFNDDLNWTKQLLIEKGAGLAGWSDYDYRIAPIKAFRSSHIAKSRKLTKDLASAIGLLRAFQKGDKSPSEVFDIESMGRFLAVAELWGALHTTAWANLVLYLNPITMKFEPIGYDASIALVVTSEDGRRGRQSAGEILIGYNDFNLVILSSPEILDVYIKTLRGLAKDILEGDLLKKLKNIEQETLPFLRKEAFLLSEFPWDSMIERSVNLLKVTESKERVQESIFSFKDNSKVFPALLQTYIVQNKEGGFLEFENLTGYEVEVKSIQWIPKNNGPGVPFEPVSKVAFPIRLSPSLFRGSPETLKLYYQPPNDQESYSLQILSRIRGEKRLYENRAQRYFSPLREKPIPVSSTEEQLARHPFLTFSREEHTLHIKPGRWPVKGSLVLPVGISLSVPAGTTLQFEPDGVLIAHGSLRFQGTKQAPIILEGRAGKDGPAGWQGVVVMEADKPSEWSHVTVLNTTGINHAGWELTGGVNFYRSDVHMNYCVFRGNRGEDALNIINSKFKLENVEIIDTVSDGFDADYTEGTIVNSLFQNIGSAGGGDGVDISFSRITVDNIRFHNILDKALSVGEQSRMIATNIAIEHAGTGAASKDGSLLEISNSTINQAQVAGLLAYIKKPELGSASIKAKNITFAGSAPNARAQIGNQITIDGELIAEEVIDVENLYNTVMKAGLAR